MKHPEHPLDQQLLDHLNQKYFFNQLNFFLAFCRLLTSLNELFSKILPGTLLECQTFWSQIRTDF